MTQSTDSRVRPRGSARLIMVGTVVAVFVLVMATFANQAAVELGVWRAQALQVDETYFAACAARGTATGQFLPAGCHDNKAPLIFLAHQAVQAFTAPYDIAAIKRAAFGLTLGVAGLAAWLAWRLSPPRTALLAALFAASLVIQTLLVNVSLMALKTEMLGIAFVLMSLLACLPRRGPANAFHWVLAGVFAGLAVMSKQTFALAAFVLAAWCALSALQAPTGTRLATLAVRLACLVGGILLPVLVLLAWFAADGRVNEFLAGTFLYPSVYGSPPTSDPAVKLAAWRLADIFHTLAGAPLLLACFTIGTVAAVAGLRANAGGEAKTHIQPGFLGLVVPTTFALFSVTLIAPIFFDFHLVPAFVLMGVVGGAALGQMASSPDGMLSMRQAAPVSVGIVVLSAAAAASSFHTNAGRGRDFPPVSDAAFLTDHRGSFAYVMGMWPDIYAYNGLIPASSVQFLWALPGTPPNGLYQPPDEASERGRWLASQQRENLARLYTDFEKTPPDFIVVSEYLSRSRTSTKVSDVPGFDEYLTQHCRFLRPLREHIGSPQRLYGCGDLAK